jgi:hypothetical protein
MIWRGIGALAAIAAVGVIAGHIASADNEPATRSVRVGAATLTVAGAWRVIDGSTLANGPQRMRVVLGPAEDPSLVPAALREGTRGDKAQAARLGGYRAWSYGGVTVLPSTLGVLGVACDPGPCASAVRSVSVAGAAILAPEPDLALRLRAPTTLAMLDAARVSARAALASATATAPAKSIAATHRAALDALRPVAGPALIAALSRAEHAYDRLAQASSATGFNAARTDVIAADGALDTVVAALARAGAPVVQRPPAPATPPSSGEASALTLLLVLVVAVLVSAFAPALVRRAGTRRTAPASPSAAEPCFFASRQRTPIAPPPTYGRWNEPPRGPSAGATVSDGDARAGAMASSSTE